MKKHAEKFDTTIGQVFATKEELKENSEKMEDAQKSFRDLTRELLEGFRAHEDRIGDRLGQVLLGQERTEDTISSLQQQLATIKQELTDEFNKSNENWRIEQMKRIDAKLEESQQAMKDHVMTTVKEVAANEIKDAKEKICKMASDSAEREEEITTCVKDCKAMMEKLEHFEKQYGETSKNSARLRSDCDQSRNKINTIEREMKEVMKTMQQYKVEAEKHIKVLGDINTLSNSVEQRQSKCIWGSPSTETGLLHSTRQSIHRMVGSKRSPANTPRSSHTSAPSYARSSRSLKTVGETHR